MDRDGHFLPAAHDHGGAAFGGAAQRSLPCFVGIGLGLVGLGRIAEGGGKVLHPAPDRRIQAGFQPGRIGHKGDGGADVLQRRRLGVGGGGQHERGVLHIHRVKGLLRSFGGSRRAAAEQPQRQHRTQGRGGCTAQPAGQ